MKVTKIALSMIRSLLIVTMVPKFSSNTPTPLYTFNTGFIHLITYSSWQANPYLVVQSSDTSLFTSVLVETTKTVHPSYISSVSCKNGVESCLIGFPSNMIRIWSTQPTFTSVSHSSPKPVRSVVYDGAKLYLGHNDGTIETLDENTFGSLLNWDMQVPDFVERLTLVPGSMMFLAGSDTFDETYAFDQTTGGNQIGQFVHPSNYDGEYHTFVNFFSEIQNNRVMVGCGNGHIATFNPVTFALITSGAALGAAAWKEFKFMESTSLTIGASGSTAYFVDINGLVLSSEQLISATISAIAYNHLDDHIILSHGSFTKVFAFNDPSPTSCPKQGYLEPLPVPTPACLVACTAPMVEYQGSCYTIQSCPTGQFYNIDVDSCQNCPSCCPTTCSTNNHLIDQLTCGDIEPYNMIDTTTGTCLNFESELGQPN